MKRILFGVISCWVCVIAWADANTYVSNTSSSNIGGLGSSVCTEDTTITLSALNPEANTITLNVAVNCKRDGAEGSSRVRIASNPERQVYTGQQTSLFPGSYTVYSELYSYSSAFGGWFWFTIHQGTLVVGFPKKVSFQTPAASVDMRYMIYDGNGKLIKSVVVPAGDSPDLDLSGLDASGTLLVRGTTEGGYYDPQGVFHTWSECGCSTVSQLIARYISPGEMTTDGTTGGSVITASLPTYAKGGTGSVTVTTSTKYQTGGAGLVSVSSGNQTAGVTQQSMADNSNKIIQAVASGADQTTNAVKSLENTIKQGVKVTTSGSSSGSGTDMTATNAKIDTTNTKLGTIYDLLNGGHDYDNGTKVTAAQSAADSVAAFNGAKPAASGATVTGGSGAAGTLYTATLGGQSIEIGFAHLADMPGDSVLVAGRYLILVAAVFWFARRCGVSVQHYVTGMGSIDSGSTNVGPENIIPTVAQAKTLGTASVVVVAIFTASASVIAIVDAWMSAQGVSVANMLSGTNWAGIGAAWGLVDRYVPAAALIQLSIFSSALPYMIAPIYLGVVVVVKYVKV